MSTNWKRERCIGRLQQMSQDYWLWSKWPRLNNYWYYKSTRNTVISNSYRFFSTWIDYKTVICYIYHAILSILQLHTLNIRTFERCSFSIFVCRSTWARDEARLLHFLLDLLLQLVSTKLFRYWLRRRFGPVSPVDDTWQVPSTKPLATLCTLHRRTHKYLVKIYINMFPQYSSEKKKVLIEAFIQIVFIINILWKNADYWLKTMRWKWITLCDVPL